MNNSLFQIKGVEFEMKISFYDLSSWIFRTIFINKFFFLSV